MYWIILQTLTTTSGGTETYVSFHIIGSSPDPIEADVNILDTKLSSGSSIEEVHILYSDEGDDHLLISSDTNDPDYDDGYDDIHICKGEVPPGWSPYTPDDESEMYDLTYTRDGEITSYGYTIPLKISYCYSLDDLQGKVSNIEKYRST